MITTMTIATLLLLSSVYCGNVAAFSSSSSSAISSPSAAAALKFARNTSAQRSSFSQQPPISSSAVNNSLLSSSNDDNSTTSEAERLRQKAIRLRAEADEAEKQISPTRSSRQVDTAAVKEVAVEYFDLKDSCWELSYRFSNEPESKDDNDSKNNKVPRKFYSGKVQLQFRSDGYTTNLSTTPNNEGGDQQAIINKVWGWDLEVSDQDSLSYILFSADITLPPPISTSERFYFQARVDGGEKEGEALSLMDGSVTVKRDISAPSGGWWGIFRGADGILAQFRQLGEFRCRPIAKP
eukprot:scaffold30824_cov228-Skeletonema_menzelii.AAC.3